MKLIMMLFVKPNHMDNHGGLLCIFGDLRQKTILVTSTIACHGASGRRKISGAMGAIPTHCDLEIISRSEGGRQQRPK